MKEQQLDTVDVIIPTYYPDHKFIMLMERLDKQSYPIDKIIIMNTDEANWLATGMGDKIKSFNQSKIEVHHVDKKEFDHGKTRHIGIQYSQSDIVVCMTQDAVPKSNSLIARLVEGLGQARVAIAYACQLPDSDCGVIEQFTREFNYPDQDRIKTKEDLHELGIKTYFASNVCAAYDRKTYLALGGFTRKTIFNEDMIFAAKVIEHGYAVCYCSKAQVVHSHNYTPRQQFKRNFDLAVSQVDHPEVFAHVPSEKEGFRLVKKTAAYLIKSNKAYLIPYLIIISGFKFMGYQFGKRYRKLPQKMVLNWTMNRHYWE